MPSKTESIALVDLLSEVRSCRLCEADLPLGPRPVVQIHPSAELLIIGQAPGTKVHETGIPWNDPSGNTLRDWLQLSPEQFYDETKVAIMPMGFCYPGKGTSGDLPPRKECAPTWHERLRGHLPNIRLTLLIGQYAQAAYLQDGYKTLTERVYAYKDCKRPVLPLPHPSPRNRRWITSNPWFLAEYVNNLRSITKKLS